MDFGTKRNIINNLVKRNCIVTVYPSFTSADEIIKTSPDGIMLSNGPGDPSECVDIIKEIKKLYDYGIPTFAICLGHQLTVTGAQITRSSSLMKTGPTSRRRTTAIW